MRPLPEKLKDKLEERKAGNSYRQLKVVKGKVDFASNDYLGFAGNKTLFQDANAILQDMGIFSNGSTGSRLLTGNNSLYEQTEKLLTLANDRMKALIFNSGYDANLGFFSSVPQRNDLVLFDELAHASIRDGINAGNAKSLKFKHNDLSDLRTKLRRFKQAAGNNHGVTIYVVTESVFSMDGDSPDLKALVEICKLENCLLVVDEAHAFGIFGQGGNGLLEDLGLEDDVFAKLITFGKSLGSHGAAIVGSEALRNYLINFARSFIYTTSLNPITVATVYSAYKSLNNESGKKARSVLKTRIAYFIENLKKYRLDRHFIPSNSAIHSCIIPGAVRVKGVSETLNKANFDVRPILAPSVPENKERIRFCLHAFNTEQEIDQVLKLLSNTLKDQ